jgi:hypothetical protein
MTRGLAMSAVAQLADTVIVFDPSKWFFGGVALGTLILLLVVVTRFNVDR